MNVKIVKALSCHGYIKSKTHLFPEYIVEAGVTQPGIKKMLNRLEIPWDSVAEIREKKAKISDLGSDNAKYAGLIAEFNVSLRDAVENNIHSDDDFPLMIGGDHSSSIGSVAGILQKRPNLGVLWIDAHSDIHTPETTETGWVYGMPVAVLCGHGNNQLLEVMKGKYVKPENICLFGVRYIEEGEWKNIRDWGVNIITIDEIDELGVYPCYQKAIKMVSEKTDYLHVSLDIDVVDKMFAPGATEPTQGGLTFREINLIARKLGASGLVKSMDLVEGEPDKDINYQTGKLCLQILANVLGEKYSEYDMYLSENSI